MDHQNLKYGGPDTFVVDITLAYITKVLQRLFFVGPICSNRNICMSEDGRTSGNTITFIITN